MSFSVVIPAYNRAALLPFTLDSVMGQDEPPLDVIVVDNGSTDDTADVVARYGDRVIYRRLEQPGVQAARNLGVEATGGEWIALLDSDDLWASDHLRRLRTVVQALPDLSLVFSNSRVLRNGAISDRSKFDDAPAGWWESVIAERLPAGWLLNGRIAEASLRFHPLLISALAIRRDVFLRLGGFDVRLRGRLAEDGPLFTRCLAIGRTGVSAEPTAVIRRHDGSLSIDTSTRFKLRQLLDEADNLAYLRDGFPEMAPMRDALDREIITRTRLAAHAAFEIGEHDKMREILRRIPGRERDGKLRFKAAVAGLPTPIGLPLNRLLQRLNSVFGQSA